jgi:hypothetical protein
MDNFVVNNLKKRKKEIELELEDDIYNQSLEDELYEIKDTLEKLGINEKNHTVVYN